ncbi:MAG: hypothetical protein AVDCRST_MAG34-32, partial [uncultured Nocardioidaceae bacterium]
WRGPTSPPHGEIRGGPAPFGPTVLAPAARVTAVVYWAPGLPGCQPRAGLDRPAAAPAP